MTKNKLKFIAGITTGAMVIITIILLPSGEIEFCDNNSCIKFTQQEYEITKNDLMVKIDSGKAINWNEYQLYIKIIDFEIKKKGGVVLQNTTNENVLRKLNEEIRKK